MLGERLGPGSEVDVYELRPRIGIASPTVGERMPAGELVRDAVVTAGYAVIGRGNEYYDPADDERALRILEQLGCRRIAERAYGTLVGRGAQAGADRPCADDRSRVAACSTSRLPGSTSGPARRCCAA